MAVATLAPMRMRMQCRGVVLVKKFSSTKSEIQEELMYLTYPNLTQEGAAFDRFDPSRPFALLCPRQARDGSPIRTPRVVSLLAIARPRAVTVE